jgi:hypothetical protein
MEEKVIEVCLGVGMNQLFPEVVKIIIPNEEIQEEKEENSEENSISVD